jgi:uncharacterized protein (UPF0216 family)
MVMDLESGALKKWMSLEAQNMHKGLVTKRKSLETLLGEERPACTTRDGDEHRFDADVLSRMGDSLEPEQRSKLLLPINLFVDLNVKNECYIEDEVASTALRKLEGYDRAYRYIDGKMWLPLSIAIGLLGKYKGALQLVFLA